MNSKETIERPETTASDDAESAGPKLYPALVVLAASSDPGRAGEVLLLRGSKSALLGRHDPDYDYGEVAPLRPIRQRPGKNEERAPLELASHVSRRQLEIAAERGGRVRVTSVGKAIARVNGEIARGPVTTLEPGDTLLLGDDLLLLCQPRPKQLEPLRYFPKDALPEFGQADRCGIVGESLAVWQLRDRLAFVAGMSQHAIVTGPTGSGKELAAAAIHALSPRAKNAIVAHSAADIPPTLVEAELFGNRQNYPNAGMPARQGLIGAADGSTLFLDELGMLPTEMQAKLLRVLDEGGSYRKLGVDEPQRSDFRLVAATNRPLDLIKPDLLARLKHVVPVPPLAARREDLPLLAAHLLHRMRKRENDASIVARFDGAAAPFSLPLLDALARHQYQANLRELEQLLLSAIYGSQGTEISLTNEVTERVHFVERKRGLDPDDVTCESVRAALEECEWNITATAGRLGWSRFQLNRKMKKCGIEAERTG